MLNDEGRCPRCGKYIQVWYDMTVDDDCIMAEIYNWIPGIPGHDKLSGRFEPLKDDFKCPGCGKELLLSIKADPCIMAVSDFDDKVYVDYDEEEKLRTKFHWYEGYFSTGEFSRAYHGYARAGKYWNGWVMPWFDEDVAEMIRKDMDCKEYPFEHWTTNGLDVYAVWNNGPDDYEDGPEIYDGSEATVNCKPCKLYSIGGGCWTWELIGDASDSDVEVEFLIEDKALSHEDKVICGMIKCRHCKDHKCEMFDFGDVGYDTNYSGCNCKGYDEPGVQNVVKCHTADCVHCKDYICTKAGMLEETITNPFGKNCPGYWNEEDWNQTLLKCNVQSCVSNDGHGTCGIVHWLDEKHKHNDLGIGCQCYITEDLRACGEEDCVPLGSVSGRFFVEGAGTIIERGVKNAVIQAMSDTERAEAFTGMGDYAKADEFIKPKAEHDQEVYQETSDEMILHDIRNDEMERRCKE